MFPVAGLSCLFSIVIVHFLFILLSDAKLQLEDWLTEKTQLAFVILYDNTEVLLLKFNLQYVQQPI